MLLYGTNRSFARFTSPNGGLRFTWFISAKQTYVFLCSRDGALCASRQSVTCLALLSSRDEDSCSLCPRGDPWHWYSAKTHILLFSLRQILCPFMSTRQILARPLLLLDILYLVSRCCLSKCSLPGSLLSHDLTSRSSWAPYGDKPIFIASFGTLDPISILW